MPIRSMIGRTWESYARVLNGNCTPRIIHFGGFNRSLLQCRSGQL